MGKRAQAFTYSFNASSISTPSLSSCFNCIIVQSIKNKSKKACDTNLHSLRTRGSCTNSFISDRYSIHNTIQPPSPYNKQIIHPSHYYIANNKNAITKTQNKI